MLEKFKPIDDSAEGCISFYCGSDKEVVKNSLSTKIYVEKDFGKIKDKTLIVVDDARYAFAEQIKIHLYENKLFSIIGDATIVKETAIIGSDGFGWFTNKNGVLYNMPHIGSVKIGKNCTIGHCTCIDRGVLTDTMIGDNTKIDNLVHVAHGVRIGNNCLIVAGSIIGGSVVIGDNCFIGMGAKIKNKVKIGKNVTIGAGSVVLNDVPDGETWVGVPAKKLVKNEKTSKRTD